MKPIRLSGHALRYTSKRGFTISRNRRNDSHEPLDASRTGRLDCRKNFPYGKEWNGKVYATKQVRPIFVEEAGEIVVITVYTYYFDQP